MNYYPFHIGDYAKDTAHLSMIEDGAYRRLLDLYYVSEKPLPADKQRIHRLARALTKQEKQAIDTMLSEFFTLTDEGWTHARCDGEIAKAAAQSEENEARRRNERERQERTRVRRRELFAALREYDCVPKWDTPMEELQSMLSQYQSRACHGPVTRDSTVTDADLQRLSISQYPITNNQIKPKVKTVSSEPGEKPARSKPASRWNGAEVIRLPVVGAPEPEVPITQEFVTEMQAAYPAVDVAATLPEIRAWCLANPQKRKTASGVYRFVQSWLAREQNRG